MNQRSYRLALAGRKRDQLSPFFDISSLGAIRMEHRRFQATHQLIFRLIRDKSVTGLRVDHPDGLYNPQCSPAQRDASLSR
jgi:(1->4)-alpha-D-glucan 1-alpha-D-glucosylmutase